MRKHIFCIIGVLFLLTGCNGGGMWQGGKKAEVVAARREIYSVQAEPNNIVLMLPLGGELAASSRAIRNGFLAAYHHRRKERPSINLRIIDTTTGDISTLYQEAVQSGAEVIVGPLTKKEVETMARLSPLVVPTIALNTLDNYVHNFGVNLYQFGLLPQDEATQVAEKMMQAELDRAAIVVPENSWGNKIVEVFTRQYERAGGQVIATLRYDSFSNLSTQLCPFLAEDALKLCVPKQRKSKKTEDSKEPEEPPRRRQDINAIFLVAPAATARRIVPLLKFYYAGDLPVYTISSVYSGVVSEQVDRDLDGVYFCDMPWVLQDPKFMRDDWQAIYNQITSLWNDSFMRYRRLYALGVDVYNITTDFYKFLNAPQDGFDGASGKLYLDDYNHIYRRLQWAQMRNGRAVLQ